MSAGRTRVPPRGRAAWAALPIAAACALHAAEVQAAEFSLYLKCQGKVQSGGKSTPGRLDLALRDNNQTALVQQSNALPVGVRLKYDVSPQAYSMTYHVPGTGSTLLYDWWRGSLFVWQPSLKMVSTIRVSIDRQSGRLNGEMLNAQTTRLAGMDMACEAVKEEELPPPKF